MNNMDRIITDYEFQMTDEKGQRYGNFLILEVYYRDWLCLLRLLIFLFLLVLLVLQRSTLAQGKFQMTDRWRIPFFPDDGVGTVVFYYCDLYCNSMVYKSFINSFSLSSSPVSV